MKAASFLVLTLLFSGAAFADDYNTYSDCTTSLREFKRSENSLTPVISFYIKKTSQYAFIQTPYFQDLNRTLQDTTEQIKNLPDAIKNTVNAEDYNTCVTLTENGIVINQALTNIFDNINLYAADIHRDQDSIRKEFQCRTDSECNALYAKILRNTTEKDTKDNLKDISNAFKAIIKQYEKIASQLQKVVN